MKQADLAGWASAAAPDQLQSADPADWPVSPGWQALEEDSRQVAPLKLTFDWLKTLRLLLLSLVVLWGAGTLMSLAVNRTQIYQAQENGVYAVEDREGNKLYRTYGVKDGQAPAWYPCDENGDVPGDAQPVTAQEDYETFYRGFEPARADNAC